MAPRILILHASAGSGHKRAAEALASGFELQCPACSVTVRDILEFTPAIFRQTYAQGYLRIVRRVPELWGYMYAASDRTAQVPWRQKIRSSFNRVHTPSFRAFCDRLAPDAVVCTHFMPLELLASRMRRRRSGPPLFCAITDFAVHSLWVVRNVAAYYVATEEARRQLARRGQPDGNLLVTGIPIDPVFAARRTPEEAREALGVRTDIPTVLVLSGGFGVGPTIELLESFRDTHAPCQLLVVAGANEEMRRQAEEVARRLRMWVHVYGFVRNIDVMMDAADMVVSKPGGLTSSEVLAKGRPLLIVDPIPGQEQRNCEYLLENGAAIRIFEVQDAPDRIDGLLRDPQRLERMKAAAYALGRPDAAVTIAADVLRRL